MRFHRFKIRSLLHVSALLICFLSIPTSAAELPKLTQNSLFSVVSCTPSFDYESGFGHTAIRIQDDSLRIDVAFNFGSYDENQSFLFYKAMLGKSTSSLEGEHFRKFINYYKEAGRGAKEYYLNLTLPEKQLLWEELNRRLITNDRQYRFNMRSNNCTTQVRDLLFDQLGWNKTYFQTKFYGLTYREIEDRTPLQKTWQHVFINLFTNSEVDAPLSMWNACAVPEGLVALLKETRVNQQPLIFAENDFFSPARSPQTPRNGMVILIASVVLFVSLLFSYLQKKKGISFIFFDRILFAISGLCGCFLLSLMLFSEVSFFGGMNYHLLWLFPGNIVLAFAIKPPNVNKLWVKNLARISFLLILLFPLLALAAKQEIMLMAYFFAAALLVRLSFYIRK